MPEILKFQVLRGLKTTNFKFERGDIFFCFNCDSTELNRTSKIKCSVTERHRWAVVG